MKQFTTQKMAVITCYGANSPYDVRVPAGTTLTIHKHLSQPVLHEERKISLSAYKEHYAPPAPEPKAKPTTEDKEEN